MDQVDHLVVMDNGHVVIPQCSAELHASFGMNGTGEPATRGRTSLADGFVAAEGGGFAGLQLPQTEEDVEREKAAQEAQADRISRRARGEVVW